LNANINGKTFQCLLDSGSNLSYINKKVATNHRLSFPKLQGTNFKVRLANGASTTISHKITVKFSIRNLNQSWPLHVMDLPSDWDIILGLDWLRSFEDTKIRWNEPYLRVTHQGKRYILTPPQDIPQCNLISAKQAARVVNRKQKSFLLFCKKEKRSLNTIEVSSPLPPDNPIKAKLKQRYPDVFRSELLNGVPERPYKHAIELAPGTTPFYQRSYRLSVAERSALDATLKELLEKGLIRPSKSPYGSPVLFAPKSDGTLRFCVDYRMLNKVTIRDKYPLPLIDMLIDLMYGAKYFTTLDLLSGYWQFGIKEEDIFKTAFTTPYGHYEWIVLPMGLTNAPATFMRAMNDVFSDILEKFVVVYLDDILIFSKTQEDHEKHLDEVFKRLQSHDLIVKESKCNFCATEVTFLGHLITPDGIKPSPKKVEAISKWPIPQSISEVRSFLGLTTFYRRFVRNFSHIALPLTELTRKSVKFQWTPETQLAFDTLREKLMSPEILILPDPSKPYVVTTDASKVGIGAVLQQDHGTGLQPIAFFSRKLNKHEREWPTHEQELLAIVEALKEWRHYLHGSPFEVQTDHLGLTWLETQPYLSSKQIRWLQFLATLDPKLTYLTGKHNVVADALSRHGLNTISTLQSKITFTPKDYTTQDLLWLKDRQRYYEQDGFIYRVGNEFSDRLCVPSKPELRLQILQDLHSEATAGHLGIDKTAERVRRRYYWNYMMTDITKFVSTCPRCQEVKSSNRKAPGKLSSLPIPDSPWDSISMDFITGLPESTDKKYDSIFVIVDRLTKMAKFIPCHKSITAEHVAYKLTKHVFASHGTPIELVCDRDPKFTSIVFEAFAQRLGIKFNMSTSHHPQTDGQTERLNRTLEDMLRCYTKDEQSTWVNFLPKLEFAYNDAQQASTKSSPFSLNLTYQPRSPHDLQALLRPKPTITAEDAATRLKRAKKNIQLALDRQKRNYDTQCSESSFSVGDDVLLSTEHLTLKDSNRKLLPHFIGPFKVIKKISDVVYKLNLPNTLQVHPVFHVTKLIPFKSDAKLHPLETPPDSIITSDGYEEFVVEDILKHKGKGSSLKYLVKWRGYAQHHNTWEPLDSVKDLQALDSYIANNPTAAPPSRAPKATKERNVRSDTAKFGQSDPGMSLPPPPVSHSRSGRAVRNTKHFQLIVLEDEAHSKLGGM
jgi:hypothetical protein